MKWGAEGGGALAPKEGRGGVLQAVKEALSSSQHSTSSRCMHEACVVSGGLRAEGLHQALGDASSADMSCDKGSSVSTHHVSQCTATSWTKPDAWHMQRPQLSVRSSPSPDFLKLRRVNARSARQHLRKLMKRQGLPA